MTTWSHVLPYYSEGAPRGKEASGGFSTTWLYTVVHSEKYDLLAPPPRTKFASQVIGWYPLMCRAEGSPLPHESCLISSLNASSVPLFIFFNIPAVQQDESCCHSQKHPLRPTEQKGDLWGSFLPKNAQSGKLAFCYCLRLQTRSRLQLLGLEKGLEPCTEP